MSIKPNETNYTKFFENNKLPLTAAASFAAGGAAGLFLGSRKDPWKDLRKTKAVVHSAMNPNDHKVQQRALRNVGEERSIQRSIIENTVKKRKKKQLKTNQDDDIASMFGEVEEVGGGGFRLRSNDVVVAFQHLQDLRRGLPHYRKYQGNK